VSSTSKALARAVRVSGASAVQRKGHQEVAGGHPRVSLYRRPQHLHFSTPRTHPNTMMATTAVSMIRMRSEQQRPNVGGGRDSRLAVRRSVAHLQPCPARQAPSIIHPKRHLPRCRVPCQASSPTSTEPAPPSTDDIHRGDQSHETDVVVIGSGVGGLCAAALLATYGFRVTVAESHTVPGGCAHSWVHPKGYHFESGPSLYSGMAATGVEANPLAHIFQAIDEPLDLIEYNTWNVFLPEGTFLTKVGAENFCDVLREVTGEAGVREWRELQEHMRPLAAASAMLPPMAMRGDLGVVRTVLRYWRQLLKNGGTASKLTGPFSSVIEGVVKDPFIKNWLDLLSFLLSGLPANGTIAAEVAFMFNEWYRPDCHLEFPRGGSGAMIDALVRGLTKRGGKLLLGSHVEEVMIEGGRASGVRLRDGSTIRATKAVVSNATIWDTLKLLPEDAIPADYKKTGEEMPMCRSFMHLHLGFDAKDLPEVGSAHTAASRPSLISGLSMFVM